MAVAADARAEIQGRLVDLDGNAAPERQADAAYAIAKLTAHRAADAAANRKAVAEVGCIMPLVALLSARDSRVQEGAARALLNLSIENAANTRKIVRARDGVENVVGLLRAGEKGVRRFGTLLLSMLTHDADGPSAIVAATGEKLLVQELLENESPVPELKALCGVAHHDERASLAIADGVTHHHTFTDHQSVHSPCLLRLLELLRGPVPQVEWSVHLLYNLAHSSADIARRISAAGGEAALEEVSELPGDAVANARMYAMRTKDVLAKEAPAGPKPAADVGALSSIKQQFEQMKQERDAAQAEAVLLRQQLEAYQAGAPATPLTPLPGLPLVDTSVGAMTPVPVTPVPVTPVPSAAPPATPRDAMRQTMELLDRLQPMVENLRVVVNDGSKTVAQVDDAVQAALTELDEGVASVARFERDLRLSGPEGGQYVSQLAAAKQGLEGLREEVAELAAETEDTVDAANAEDNLAILELAEMLQSLMKAAQSH